MTGFHRIALFIALPLLVLSAIVQIKFAIMGDKGWLLLAASKWLAGDKLYTDIFEVNPPLIVWLYAIPAGIAQHCMSLADYQALGLLGVIATLMAALLTLGIIAPHPVFTADAGKRIEFALLTGGILLFVISPVYFFDREHITLAFTLPYLLRFAPTLTKANYPPPLRIGTGFLAAIGFCIKPHAVLFFLALQLVYLVRDRSPFILASVENIIIYLFATIYLSAIFYFTPQYFTTVLPMAVAVYASYTIAQASLHYYLPLILISTAIPLLDFRPRYRTPYRADIYYFMAVTLLYLGYALLNNGWGYTYQPFFSMLTLLTVWLLWEYIWLKAEHKVKGLPSKQFDLGLRGSLYCLTLTALYAVFTLRTLLVSQGCGGFSDCDANKPFVDALRQKHIASFGVMSGEFTRWPLISRQSGARWETRFNNLWMAPGLIKAQERQATSDRWAKDQWIVTYVGQALADDLHQRKPQVMFVDNSDAFFTYPPRNVDILALFKGVAEFDAAWRHYHYDSTINRCKSKIPASLETVGCRYDIYRRRD